MTLTLVTVSGRVVLPDGTFPTSGKIRFKNIFWDREDDDLIIPTTVDADIDGSGNTSIDVWASAGGVNRVYYKVTAQYYSATFGRVVEITLGQEVIVPNVAAISLTDLLDTVTIPSTRQSVLAEVRALKVEAIAAAERAEAAVSAFANVAEVISDTGYTYSTVTAGQILRTAEEGFAYEVAAAGASDQHLTTAGGVKLYALAVASGYDVRAFGAVCDGVTDDTEAVRRAFASGRVVRFPASTIRLTDTIDLTEYYGVGIIGAYCNPFEGAVTKFVMDASNKPIFKVRGPVKLVDFAFEYVTQQSATDTASIGIAMYRLAQFEIRNVYGQRCAITIGIPQETLTGFADNNYIFSGSIENVWSYTASITHFDLRGYNAGNTNCRIGPLYINGGELLDLTPVPPTITTPGQECSYAMRMTNWSGAEIDAVSIDGIKLTECGVELVNFFGVFRTLRIEGALWRKNGSGIVRATGGSNQVQINFLEFRSVWTQAADALTSMAFILAGSTICHIDVADLRIQKTSINDSAGALGRFLSTVGVTDVSSSIFIGEAVVDGDSVNIDTAAWTQASTYFPPIVKSYNGRTITQSIKSDRSTAVNHIVYLLTPPTASYTYGAPAAGDRVVKVAWGDFGRVAEWVYSGTLWVPVSLAGGESSISTVATDADFTLTPQSSRPAVLHTGTLTADRTVTLSTTSAWNGCTFRVTRTGGGAFNLSVGGLKNLATGQWCEAVYDGGAWRLMQYGAL